MRRKAGKRASGTTYVLAVVMGIAAATAGANAEPPAGYTMESEYFASADGTMLHADVMKPADLANEERRPVLMVVTPYAAHGSCNGTFSVPTHVTTPPPCYYLPWIADGVALERRWVVAQVDARGFGASEGCWDAGGRREQEDVKSAVEWAASQPWSNGRVALVGLSYDGWTGIMALATSPRGLVGVATQSPVVNLYGALYDGGVPRWTVPFMGPAYSVWGVNQPGSLFDTPEYHRAWAKNSRPDCQGIHTADIHDPDPSTAFWRERDLLARASQSDVPVFGTHGFLDFNVPVDELTSLYPRLQKGRGLWLGQFVHRPVGRSVEDDAAVGRSATEELRRFLVGVLEASPSIDAGVTVQEAPALRWRQETRWPPADSEPFIVPVLPGTYVDRPGNGAGDDVYPVPFPPLPASALPSGVGSWTFSQQLPHEVHLAGSARLEVEVEGPPTARLVALLYDVAPDRSALLITRGATLIGGGRQLVTLSPQDWRVGAGHRFGLLISGADDSWWMPHAGTGATVEIRSGAINLPALRCVRDRFLDGSQGDFWNKIKRPIRMDARTIEARSIVGEMRSRDTICANGE